MGKFSENFMYQYYCLVVVVFFVLIPVSPTWGQGLVNTTQLQMFVDQLPEIPRILGYDVTKGGPVSKTLNIGMFHKKWKFHRDLPPTDVFAYGESLDTASVPGPTIEALHGVDTYVTWQNYLPDVHILPWDPTIPTAIPSSKKGVPTVVHLHGGIEEPESDGHAEGWFTAGFQERGPKWTKKTYHYHNLQHPGNMWYHDHAMGLTRVNLLAGLIGAYILRQPDVEALFGLPWGDEFDRPLVIFDREFRTDGSIYMNATGNNPSIHPQWRPEYFGDAIIVNGKAWPQMIVKRRKYRFRIINASNARYFKFSFTNGLEFIHVGSDSTYDELPITISELLLGPSEIADVIIDFSKSNSNSVILANNAPYPYPSGNQVNEANSKVMKFVINPNPQPDPSRVPQTLIKYPSPDLSAVALTRYIVMYEYTSATNEPTHLYINGKSFSDPVTEQPKVGTSEIWDVINLTGDNHPFHLHLGLFVVLDQTQLVNLTDFTKCMTNLNDAIKCNVSSYATGPKFNVLAHEKGWKNVYKVTPGYVTRILARFSYIHSNIAYPFDATAEPGYAYHCHILDHEDNVMIRPLKLV